MSANRSTNPSNIRRLERTQDDLLPLNMELDSMKLYSSNPYKYPDFETAMPTPTEEGFNENELDQILKARDMTPREKISILDEKWKKLPYLAKKKYRAWRFEHDKTTIDMFVDKQNQELQKIIKQGLNSDTSLDDFYRTMNLLLQIFNDKDAFVRWAKSECLLNEEIQITGMHILTGGKFSFMVKANESVKNLKDMVFEQTGIPVSEQTLIFGGKKLEDGKNISDYKLDHTMTFHLVKRFTGG